jgi:hypothetical protein
MLVIGFGMTYKLAEGAGLFHPDHPLRLKAEASLSAFGTKLAALLPDLPEPGAAPIEDAVTAASPSASEATPAPTPIRQPAQDLPIKNVGFGFPTCRHSCQH